MMQPNLQFGREEYTQRLTHARRLLAECGLEAHD